MRYPPGLFCDPRLYRGLPVCPIRAAPGGTRQGNDSRMAGADRFLPGTKMPPAPAHRWAVGGAFGGSGECRVPEQVRGNKVFSENDR